MERRTYVLMDDTVREILDALAKQEEALRRGVFWLRVAIVIMAVATVAQLVAFANLIR